MAISRRSSRSRPRYVLVVLLLVAVTLITLSARSANSGVLSDIRGAARDAFSPLQHATHDALQPIGNFLSGAVHYGSLRQENQRLRNEITSLQANAIQSASQQSQAQQVLGLAHLPFVGQIPAAVAEVIDRGAANFETTVTINKGTSSGIAVGQPVVAAGGLVGTIEQAGSRTSTVQLLTDPSFAVGVTLDASNTGTAEGSGQAAPLRVVVDTPQAPRPTLARGRAVVTSGLSMEKFPPDIPVGKVASVSMPPGASEPTITLTPLVNLNQLSALEVLLWSPQ
ncbi:MAG: rod shape-determining protein MreC [Acidimicrobiaceae bacterium]|nr:rod shape-determining protein MreC [Acidimicrobiaceae bacterium]